MNIIYKKLNPFDIAFLYKGNLYLDEFLIKYPKLELEVLKHELKHVENNSESRIKDYLIDLKGSSKLENLKVLLKHKPFYVFLSAFIPFRRVDKEITIDESRFINFAFLFGFILFWTLFVSYI